MTVAELIKELAGLDGTKLVCINTAWFVGKGVYPIADTVTVMDSVNITGEGLDIVVLEPSGWPERLHLALGLAR